MNIIIVGPARSGKTTLAQTLFEALDRETQRHMWVCHDPAHVKDVAPYEHWILCTQNLANVPLEVRKAAQLVYSCTTSTTPFHWAVNAL